MIKITKIKIQSISKNKQNKQCKKLSEHNKYVHPVPEKSIYKLLWLAEKKLHYVFLWLDEKPAKKFSSELYTRKNMAKGYTGYTTGTAPIWGLNNALKLTRQRYNDH